MNSSTISLGVHRALTPNCGIASSSRPERAWMHHSTVFSPRNICVGLPASNRIASRSSAFI